VDNFTGVAAVQGLDVGVVVGKQFLVTVDVRRVAEQLENLEIRVEDDVLVVGREYRSGGLCGLVDSTLQSVSVMTSTA
jgi:hypothetical protein